MIETQTHQPQPRPDKRRQLEGSIQSRSVTDEQLARIKAESVRRDFQQAEVREIDEENRTVELAFSSEAEVERWFGIEVLDHSNGAMRTGRLENGAALLVNHDRDDQVGVVESVSIGADRRGRAVVRFGKSTRASEIWQDIVDGIRKHVSVSYSIYRVEVEERNGEPDRVTVTDWEPLEISIVSIPADASVGVGRSAEPLPAEGRQSGPDTGSQDDPQNPGQRAEPMKEKILRDAEGNLVRAKVNENDEIQQVLETIERAGEGEQNARTAGQQAEQKRTKDIMDLGRSYGNTELAAQYVSEGKSPEEFQRALLDSLHQERSKPLSDNGGAIPSGGSDGSSDTADLGLGERDVKRYSLMRAIRAMANPQDHRAQEAASFEREVSRAAQDKYGKEARGILVPYEVLARGFNTGGAPDSPTGAQSGGDIVADQFMPGSFIDMLRNNTILMRVARTMSGLVGNPTIPKQVEGTTAYWVGEGESPDESTPEITQIGMSPKTIGAYTEISRRLMMQSTPDAEALVRESLAESLALEIDRVGFYGTGGNQPLGIAQTSGINAVNLGTTGKPTYEEVVEMESKIASDNADVSSMLYALHSQMVGHFKTTQKFDGTNGAPIWEQGNTVNGYRAERTNQVQSGDLFFGNFRDLIVGLWGGLDLGVNPYSKDTSGDVRVTALQDVDMVVRRAESFCLGRNTTA